MRKLYSFALSLLFVGPLFAGGILTNTNQSSMFTRMQARDATFGIDAVYYNPAGLSFLPNNGFFVSIHNQTLGQTRNISSDYPFLNNSDYQGDVFAPIFPSVFLAYKMDKLTISAGFNVIGGGGGGVYEDGLPSFEYPLADLSPALNPGLLDPSIPIDPNGALGYRMDINFEGSSAWFGYQANISYKINDMISVALGGRLVVAKDTYNGYLRDIQLNMGGTWTDATDVFTGLSTLAAAGATQTGEAGANIDAAITGGILNANDPLADPTAIATLTYFEVYQEGMTNEQAADAFGGISTGLTTQAQTAGATAVVLQDQVAETEATATGITPIISVDIKPNDKLNFSVKYEHQTKLEFTYDTESDFIIGFNPDGTQKTKFPDGTKYRKDMPSQLVIGATFKPVEKLLLSTGYHTYFDQQADWSGAENDVDGNSWEFAIGAEYKILDNLAASIGWLTTKSGVTEAYQSDLSYSLPSNTIGGGFEYNISKKLALNLAGAYTMYTPGEKNFDYDFASQGLLDIPIKEDYDKDVWIVSIGINFNLGAK